MGRGHRWQGYRLLSGHGIEIGALHAPASLPPSCSVTYVDVITTSEARKLFPEIAASRLVEVGIVSNLDTEGLAVIADSSYDFVVLNHVIEHVANPIRVIGELFRVVKPGGLVVISAPDKRFSFDRDRAITSNEHLLSEYREGVDSVSDEHYKDFVRAVRPQAMSTEAFGREVLQARERREHAHVWDSIAFEGFLKFALETVGTQANVIYRSSGDSNVLEHFSVWTKIPAG